MRDVLLEYARRIASVLKSRLDQELGELPWSKVVFRLLTMYRRSVLRLVLNREEILNALGEDSETVDRAIEWMEATGIVVRATKEPKYLLSPLGVWWLEQGGSGSESQLQHGLAKLGEEALEVLRARLDRSIGGKEAEELNVKDASFLLLLLIAGAIEPQRALRVDKTGERVAEETCGLLNYVVQRTTSPAKAPWDVNTLLNYTRERRLAKGTGELVQYGDWRQGNPVVRINLPSGGGDEGLRYLMRAVLLSPLVPASVLALVKEQITQPLYANVKNLGDLSAAFGVIFGEHQVPASYRKRLAKLAEELWQEMKAEEEEETTSP